MDELEKVVKKEIIDNNKRIVYPVLIATAATGALIGAAAIYYSLVDKTYGAIC